MLNENSTTGNAVVIGAGTMGGGIAAQLANAGWTVTLLDVTDEAAEKGKQRVRDNRPPLLFLPEFADRIRTGMLETGADVLRSADWIVEAVAESMPIKQAVMAQIAAQCGSHTVLSSNTSGLSLREMSAVCPPDFRRRFLGTHFLNPPRYLKLLELVALPDTDAEIASDFRYFAEHVLGHRTVWAKDTPGFISTRIWITHLLDSIHTALEQNLSVAEVDAVTGSFLGRPKSATFRMADIVGLDIIAAIAKNQYEALPNDPMRERLLLPDPLQQLLADGRTGAKTGAGFYKREGKAILALDWNTLTYAPIPPLDTSGIDDMAKRPLAVRHEFIRSHPDDLRLQFAAQIMERLDQYVNAVAPEIADDVLSVDNVMEWGFGWEIGPFRFHDEFHGVMDNYRNGGSPPQRTRRVFAGNDFQLTPETPYYIDLNEQIAQGKTLLESPVGALIELKYGVACLEFRTKMNTLNPELCAFMDEAITYAEQHCCGLVIANQGTHFSAGYDLKRLLSAIEAQDYDAVDGMMHAVQQVYQRLKFTRLPVVAAPHGYTLGGGCECVLHSRYVVPVAELQMGLPETAAGLVPNGGGMKELLLRSDGTLESLLAAMKLLVFPPTSANAYEARQIGLLAPETFILPNADMRIDWACGMAREMWENDYSPATPVRIKRQGEAMRQKLLAAWHESVAAETLSAHDELIAGYVAEFLCGTTSEPAEVSEHDLLDHERDIFQRLIRTAPTVERIRHLMTTGKPLRN
jgi:3-hydroxyacyl-CoA dehydrogenase